MNASSSAGPRPAEAQRGFITVATHSIAYAEMAVDMALSLRDWHAEPVCVIVDEVTEPHIRANYPGVFDHFAQLPARYRSGHAAKFSLALLSPFEKTIFIDADTLVQGSVAHLWEDLGQRPMVMIGEYAGADSTLIHHGFAVPELIREFRLQRYFKNHSGAFAFDGGLAAPLMEAALDVFLRMYRLPRRLRGYVGDEIAFGIVAERFGVEPMRPASPVMWTAQINALAPGDRPKPLFHFIASPKPPVMDWLMADVTRRRLARGFDDVSIRFWRAKAAKSSRNVAIGHWVVAARQLWSGVFGSTRRQ